MDLYLLFRKHCWILGENLACCGKLLSTIFYSFLQFFFMFLDYTQGQEFHCNTAVL
jgi:hypothetical protein